MATVFVLLFFVCLFGVFRPFKGLKRWHFGVAAFASFVLIGVTAPASKDDAPTTAKSNETSLTPAQALALEKKNAVQIEQLRKKADSIPVDDVDGGLSIYKQLSLLAPANATFAAKVSEYETKVASRSRYEDHPEEAITISDFDWNTGGFGSIMEISKLTLKNDAPFPLKDFKIRCVHQGNSGTDMDSNTRTLFEIVPANETKTFRGVNMGFISSQAKTTNCEITSAVKA